MYPHCSFTCYCLLGWCRINALKCFMQFQYWDTNSQRYAVLIPQHIKHHSGSMLCEMFWQTHERQNEAWIRRLNVNEKIILKSLLCQLMFTLPVILLFSMHPLLNSWDGAIEVVWRDMIWCIVRTVIKVGKHTVIKLFSQRMPAIPRGGDRIL